MKLDLMTWVLLPCSTVAICRFSCFFFLWKCNLYCIILPERKGKKRSNLFTVCTFLVLFLAVNLLQMLDLNVTIAFPAAPLFTVILSLVGKYVLLKNLHSLQPVANHHDKHIFLACI